MELFSIRIQRTFQLVSTRFTQSTQCIKILYFRILYLIRYKIVRYKLYNMFIDKFSVTYKVTEEQKKEKKRHS